MSEKMAERTFVTKWRGAIPPSGTDLCCFGVESTDECEVINRIIHEEPAQKPTLPLGEYLFAVGLGVLLLRFFEHDLTFDSDGRMAALLVWLALLALTIRFIADAVQTGQRVRATFNARKGTESE